jgi:hypothetical protein
VSTNIRSACHRPYKYIKKAAVSKQENVDVVDGI